LILMRSVLKSDLGSRLKAFLIVLLLLIEGCAEHKSIPIAKPEVKKQATYTITGIKDKRLDAWYLASYVSQNTGEKCTSKNYFTGGKRHRLDSRTVQVEDGNYSIDFPIHLTGENNDCDYRFRSLKLVMKRKYDTELSSIHNILSDKQKVHQTYWKTYRGAMSLKHPDTPPIFSHE